jgi:fibronectin type 3 domain-containing protein
MATPYQVQNVTAEQSDGNILISWSGSLGATNYIIQRSTDGVNFTTLATVGLVTSYIDSLPGTGIMYYYNLMASNVSGTSPVSSTVQMVAAPPSEMSLYELRLRSQQTADRVNSSFVSTTEWNAFLRLACYELYDLLVTSYEDYFCLERGFYPN